MPLASIIEIIDLSDSFWGNATLDVLRLLTSTSKELHAKFHSISSSNSNSSNNNNALKSMIKNRPRAFNFWRLKMSDAKYRFSLQLNVMVGHCVALPEGHRCRMHAVWDDSHIINADSAYIPFMDAYKLAVDPGTASGMKAAMERRYQFDTKVKNTVRELINRLAGFDFRLMGSNIDDAVYKLGNVSARLKWGWENGDGFEHEVIPKINALSGLSRSVYAALMEIQYFPMMTPPKAETAVLGFIERVRILVSLYRSYSEYCAEAMSLDFLPDDF
jgi:hypothetical protein